MCPVQDHFIILTLLITIMFVLSLTQTMVILSIHVRDAGFTSFLALPCFALPCLALPCLALPCLALPCLGPLAPRGAVGELHDVAYFFPFVV